MNDVQKMKQEKNVLRWGGLAGMLGGVLCILTWVVIIAGPVGMEDPADLAGWVMRFPDIRAARVVENGIYLVAAILGVILFLAFYRALRGTSLAPALFGSTLAILGLVVTMAAALPHVAHAPLSDLYHAPGATPADQATLALLWQAIWGIFDAMLYVAFFVVPAGLILLGVGMLGSRPLARASAG
jgi:predicted membrane channel-forming protein YqfA (hemolysin III family)